MDLAPQVTPRTMANNADTPATDRALLMTRPKQAAEQFVARLDPTLISAVQIVHSPLLQIVPQQSKADPARYNAVIFTSATAVGFAGHGQGQHAFCVGARTAQAAQDSGWRVRIVAQDADALVEKLQAMPGTGPLLHLAGAHRRGEIATRLGNAGTPVDVSVLYDQALLPLNNAAKSLLAGKTPVIVPLFSPRTAVQFAKAAASSAPVHVVAISAAVAAPLDRLNGTEVRIVAAPTGDAMLQEVELLLRKDSLA